MYATGKANGNYRHGLSRHPLYKLWKRIRLRCNDIKNNSYKDYGGRGINLCPLWLEHPDLFIEWSLSHGYQKGLQIDRIDNDGPYSPDNCRWVTNKVNSNNRRNSWLVLDGEEWITVSSYSERHGITPGGLRKRIYLHQIAAKRMYPVHKSLQ